MAITYPLTLPTSVSFTDMQYIPRTVVGFSASRFTGQQQTYVWPGQWWEVRCKLPPLTTDALADAWIAFLLSLNGRHGTFNMGPSTRKLPNILTALAQVGSGGATANSSTLPITLFSAGSGLTVGDWIQHGTGASARLHRIVQVNAFVGTAGSVEIFPRARSAYAAGSGLVLTNPVGHFRLASDDSMGWSVDLAKNTGLEINAMEVL
jgi:hypothetical protein